MPRVDLPKRAIAELEPHDVGADVPGLNDVVVHGLTPKQRSD
jgi:hypothetical protein